ncbi:hypothetical protein CCACVL1_03351 [Corchorus capsularis]|uniref:Uncharacterized protein n=1 Tax=Corchorus capsularis TaxID=210143 RepID=A0A1R3K018_COCAP|nr:hypothetical protein CCACVL1_03351 [Corchorus capsularis]
MASRYQTLLNYVCVRSSLELGALRGKGGKPLTKLDLKGKREKGPSANRLSLN